MVDWYRHCNWPFWPFFIDSLRCVPAAVLRDSMADSRAASPALFLLLLHLLHHLELHPLKNHIAAGHHEVNQQQRRNCFAWFDFSVGWCSGCFFFGAFNALENLSLVPLLWPERRHGSVYRSNSLFLQFLQNVEDWSCSAFAVHGFVNQVRLIQKWILW